MLNPIDQDNHAISFAALECALEHEDIEAATRTFVFAHKLRRMEEAETHDGIPQPVIERFRALAAAEPDMIDAFCAVRAAINAAIQN